MESCNNLGTSLESQIMAIYQKAKDMNEAKKKSREPMLESLKKQMQKVSFGIVVHSELDMIPTPTYMIGSGNYIENANRELERMENSQYEIVLKISPIRPILDEDKLNLFRDNYLGELSIEHDNLNDFRITKEYITIANSILYHDIEGPKTIAKAFFYPSSEIATSVHFGRFIKYHSFYNQTRFQTEYFAKYHEEFKTEETLSPLRRLYDLITK